MDRKSAEYREARRIRRLNRKAKALGITVEEYLEKNNRSKKITPDYTQIAAREKNLRKLATSALCKRAMVHSGNRVTDRQEAILILLGVEFPGLVQDYLDQK